MRAQHRSAFDWLTIAGPVLTLVGIVVGIWQFNVGEQNRQTLEFRRNIWLQKAQSCQDIARVVGDTVAHYDASRKNDEDLYRKFMSAYWGTMILVEDDRVEAAMKRFYLELRDVRSGWAKDSGDLKIKADALIKECRRSIEADRPGGNNRT